MQAVRQKPVGSILLGNRTLMKSFCKSLVLIVAMALPLSAQGGGGKAPSEENRKGPMRGGKGDRSHRPLSVKGFMSEYDTNGDLKVSFAEFGSSGRAASLGEAGRRRLFDHLDKNDDGEITLEELPSSIPPSVRGHDSNKDGRITLDEFSRNPRVKGWSADRLEAMFSRMDRDGNKVLTAADFSRRPGSPLHPAEIERLDVNKDGGLTFEEWARGPRQRGIPVGERRKIFNKMDRDQNGKLEGSDRGRPRGRGEGEGGRRPTNEE